MVKGLRDFYSKAVRRSEETYTGFLGWWVATACRFRWTVIAVFLAAAAYGGWYSTQYLGMNTDTAGMLARSLPFQKRSDDLGKAFPQFSDNILIVIDASTPDLADDAAEAVVRFMKERPKLFLTVFDPEGDPFFRRNGLLFLGKDELTDLADKLAAAQPVLGSLSQDPSLRGLVDMLKLAIDDISKGNKPPVDMTDALNRIAAAIEAQAKGSPRPLSWREMMLGRDAKPGELRRLILIQPTIDYSSLNPAADAIDALREFARQNNWTGTDTVRMRLTGTAALAQDELGSIRQQMGWISVVSFITVVVLLAIGLQSVLLVVTTSVCLTVGLLLTTWFATVAIGSLNLLSVAFAVLFIGLSDDFGAHFTLRYREELATGRSRLDALRRTGEGNGGALTLCAVTAAISFFSFLPTDYRGVAELGLIAGAGMFVALIVNMTLLPAILSLLPLKVKPPAKVMSKPMIDTIVESHPRPIVWGAVLFCLASIAVLPFARFDADPLKMKDPRAESVQAVFDLAHDSTFGPYDLNVLAPNLAEADKIAERLRKIPEVDSVITLSNFVPKDQPEKLEIISDISLFLTPLLVDPTRKPPPTAEERRALLTDLKRRLDAALAAPDLPATLAAALKRLSAAIAGQDMSDKALADLEKRLLGALPPRLEALRDAMGAQALTLKDLPADVVERQIAKDGRARVQVFPKKKLIDIDDLRAFVRVMLHNEPESTGTSVTVVLAGKTVIHAFHVAAVIALVMIVALLLILLGNWRDTALVFLPLVLAGILTAATAVLVGQDFNFANIIVLPLMVGLGVASGIHLVLRDRELDTHHDSVLETSTPRAVIVSALTTISSFGTLMLSDHKGVFSMGLLLTIGITLNLVVTLVVLPALLALRRQNKAKKKSLAPVMVSD